MSNNDIFDLSSEWDTNLTEAGYDGKFKVHINCPINGMFQTIDVSDGTEKVIIKNTCLMISCHNCIQITNHYSYKK
mgnify:CR=1 FL=1